MILTKLEHLKAQLDNELNETSIYQKDWGQTWSRIYIEKQQGKIDDDLMNWAIDKMAIFIRIFQPELDKIQKG